MIAIKDVPKKYTGIKSIESQTLFSKGKRVLDKLPASTVEILERVLRTAVEFVDNPIFHTREGEESLLRGFEEPDMELSASEARLLPIDIFEEGDKALTAFKPLTMEQETKLFLRLNYARYRIYLAVKDREGKPLTMKTVQEILEWRKEELTARSQITQANIPLVLAMAKRSKLIGVDFTELISEGNMALLRSVDKFDCSRGFKFSTYACRAILKSFARVTLKANRYRGRFPVEFDPELEKSDYLEQKREDTKIYCMDRLREILGDNSSDLNDVERRVLRSRFGIREEAEPDKPKTLEQVGKEIGVTKERVRQIQNKALLKLKVALEDHVF
jgi:RNA polymerase sigma factor (sigma-70 family)